MASKVKVNTVETESGSTLTLGKSGDTVTLASGASQSGFGRTGTVDWDTTPKTASFNAVSGDGFFCNTTSSAFTATLPSGAAGAIVSFADYAGTWQTNNLTISPQSGEKIGGESANVILNTEGQSVTFIYVDSTQGWINVQDSTSNERANPYIIATGGTVTTCGNDKIHTFTGPGTFTVTQAANCSADNVVSHVVVAGGGGGGAAHGGGGGAGGYREVKSPSSPYTASPLDGYPSAPNRVTVTATSFPITVGGGGAAATDGSPSHKGSTGTNSVFSTITSAGGGGGAGEKPAPAQTSGDNGGSGGGGSSNASVPTGTAGTGNSPPVTPAQGSNGGTGSSDQVSYRDGGGGGGATAAGTSSSGSTVPAPGGAGATSSINGTPTARAGGGGGGRTAPPAGSGGSGGGGAGSFNCSSTDGGAGTANTGGGGGGGGNNLNGGAGGSGIVIIRYKFQ